MSLDSEKKNAEETITKLVQRMDHSLQEVEPVRLLLTVLKEALKEKLQSDRTAVFNALFSELLKEDVAWGDWKGERFPPFILDAWLELKTRKFFDSAVPGPDLIQEDDIEPILQGLVKLLNAVDDPATPSYPAQMDLLVAKWKLRRTRDKDKVRVAFVGVESCGKSTMVNHLIGTQALPTAAGMGTNSVMWVRNAPRTSVTVDDGAPEYPTNLQECLKLKLDDPAEEVLKIETPWTHSLGSVDVLDVPGLKVSKTSFTFQDNTAKHSAIAMAMADIIVLCCRDAETLRGQLGNANLLKTLPELAGDKPVICACARIEPKKFEEQRTELRTIMRDFFPNSKATEVVYCNMMFPEFREGREALGQLFKMKPRRPDAKAIWRDVYKTALKAVKAIQQKFDPLERTFERQFHPLWGDFKDQLASLYSKGEDNAEEAEREELRKIMKDALAATGFEASLRATVARMQPMQLSLFKKQDDFGRGSIHVRWNLIGEVRKAVFGATDYLGHELWRRYILKGLDLLVQGCNLRTADKVVVALAHKLLGFDCNRQRTLQDRDLYASGSIVDLCNENTFRNLFTGFYFVLLDPPCAYDIMKFSPGGKAYWKAYVEPCQRIFSEFNAKKYPEAVAEPIDSVQENASTIMRTQLLRETGNVATFLSQCPVIPQRDSGSPEQYSSMVLYVLLHISIGFLYRSVCNNLGENTAALTPLGILLMQKANETPFACALQALRNTLPKPEDKASDLREYYQTCRSVLTTLQTGRAGELFKGTLDSVRKTLDQAGNHCDLLFDPGRLVLGQKIVVFTPTTTASETGRNMEVERAYLAALSAHIAAPATNLKIIRDGDDVPSDQYCAAVVIRSQFDRDTADLSAREKDILKSIETWGTVARVYVLIPDQPDAEAHRFVAPPSEKDDPFRRVRRMILSPEDAGAGCVACEGCQIHSGATVPPYLKLTVRSLQIVDPQVLPSDEIALVIKTDAPEFVAAFGDGMKASKETPKPSGSGLGVEWNTEYVLPVAGGKCVLMVELTLLRAGVGHVTFGVFEVTLTPAELGAMAPGKDFVGRMLRGGATVGRLRVDVAPICKADLENVETLRPKKGRAEEWVRKALATRKEVTIDEGTPVGQFLAELCRIQQEGLGPKLVKENVANLKRSVCDKLEEVSLILDSRELTTVGPDLRGRTIEESVFDAYDKALSTMDERAKNIRCTVVEQVPKWFQFQEANIDKIIEKTPVLAGTRIAGFPELWARMHVLVYCEVALVHMSETMSAECWHGLFEPELEELAKVFGIEPAVLLEELKRSDDQWVRTLVDQQAFVAMVIGFAMMFSVTYIAWQVFAKFNTPTLKHKDEFRKIHMDCNQRFMKLFEAV